MAEILALRALRYSDSELSKVVAPPYDVIDDKLRAELGARSPHNIVHVDLPEGTGDQKYARAAALLEQWIDEGVLNEDSESCLIRYDQTFTPPEGGTEIRRRGFFALVRAEPYEKRVVLPHERTLSGPKEDRYKLFRATRAAVSPVFFLYTDRNGETRGALECAKPGASFTTTDGIRHELARLTDAAQIARVTRALEKTELLIADGHHRYETTVKYGTTIDDECRALGRPALDRGAHKYVLAFLADAGDPGLVVFPTHRLVHGLKGFSSADLLQHLGSSFEVNRTTATDVPDLVQALAQAGRKAPSVVAVFPNGDAAILTLRKDVNVDTHPALASRPRVLRSMDVVVLHAAILESALGITLEHQAAQTHLSYIKSATDAVARIKKGEGDVLFLMNPTPVSDVRKSCEAGEVMPQKSTFFYPKVLTGLAIHVLDPYVDVWAGSVQVAPASQPSARR